MTGPVISIFVPALAFLFGVSDRLPVPGGPSCRRGPL
jgi:hypothetical protein